MKKCFFLTCSILIMLTFFCSISVYGSDQNKTKETIQGVAQKSTQDLPDVMPQGGSQGVSGIPKGMPVPQVEAPQTVNVATGTLSGQIMIKSGGPLSKGMVFFFNKSLGPPPSQEMYWRIPDHIEDLDNNGMFSADLPVGVYYLGAIKRISGREVIGPPMEGDLFYAGQDEQGIPIEYTINAGDGLDVGILSETIPFSRSMVKFGKGITSIEGTILEADNKPVQGALVYAFVVPSTVGRPLFVSDRTGADGRYILRVHEGGKYHLRVRDIYGGGPPVTGALIGGYGEKAPVPVEVKTGEILKGIDIKVARFLGRGPKVNKPQVK